MNIIKPLDPHVVNILSVYARADKYDRQKGIEAYRDYHQRLVQVTEEANRQSYNNVPLNKVCGVFSALSPNSTYESNLTSATNMISAYVLGKGIDSFKVSTYGANKQKAWDLLNDESAPPQWWITAKKTQAFYWNIYRPDEDVNPVVVDGHMYSIWQLKQVRMSEAKIGNNKQYDRIANDVRIAARLIGIGASQMQAVCWFTWKRVNRIAYDTRELQHRLWIER